MGRRDRRRVGETLGAIVAGVTVSLTAVGLAVPLVVARGADGASRSSVFDLALVVLDPITRASWLSSVGVAAATAAIAWVVGVGLGRPLGRWRFAGRDPLSRGVLATVAVPPMLGALGLRLIAGDAALDPRAPILGPGWAWAALVWVEVASLAPLVVLAVARGVGSLDPSWEEAGRASGATLQRAWRDLAWPQVKPSARRAVATVFALALLDPGAPLALGLERALPVRIIRAATVEAAPTRAAALAVLGLATASVVALALRGRRGWSDLEAATLARPTPTSNGVPGGWARGLGLSVAMVAWGVFAWAPIVSLAQPVVASWAPEGGTAGSLARSLAAIVRRPGWYEPVATGAIVGALVAVGSLTMAGWGASGRAGRIARWAGRWVPPLGLAVGLLNAGPALVAASEQASWLGWLGAVGRFIDPYATFGTALVLGLLLVHRPRAVAAVAAARARCGPELVEVGVTLGASGRQARRDLQRPLAAPTRLRAGLLIGALAAADVGLALPLTPMSRPSMPAVAVLDQFDETGGRLAAAVLGLTIAAVAAGAWVAGGPIEPRPEP